MLFCTFFAFALVGCGDAYTDEDDYANFVRWQERYETEKELVRLLREYNDVYVAYNEFWTANTNVDDIVGNKYFENISQISFVFNIGDETIFTDANIQNVSILYDSNTRCLCVVLDSTGAQKLIEKTAAHIGEQLQIIELRNGVVNDILLSATISSAFSSPFVINEQNENNLDKLYLLLGSKCAENPLQKAAQAYNEKRSTSMSRLTATDYLPANIPEQPVYIDVAPFLEKAELKGF